MTAEIAILNKEAVALAADSAVTMISQTGDKIFTSANKLFTLSKYYPVGVMIYGDALFMNIPWETLIKIYRKKLGTKSFSTIKEYAEDFINFLANEKNFSEEAQEMYIRRTLYSYLNFIKENIKIKIDSELENKNILNENDIKHILKEFIDEQYNLWENGETSKGIADENEFHNKILKKYKETMNSVIKEVLQELPLSVEDRKKIINILAFLFYKFPEDVEYSGMSGIVIAGFGDKEIFPSLVSYKIEGFLEGSLKYKLDIGTNMGFKTGAIIIPFAQKDVVNLFMEGVYKDYLSVELSYLNKLLQDFLDEINKNIKHKIKDTNKIVDSILEDFKNKLSMYRINEYTDPIMKVVSLLPKPELAIMAETLVNLTSLKRRWSTEQETVGGPIDVALISKGDGFIWIKRKHYFKPELNPYFFEKYYMEVKG